MIQKKFQDLDVLNNQCSASGRRDVALKLCPNIGKKNCLTFSATSFGFVMIFSFINKELRVFFFLLFLE